MKDEEILNSWKEISEYLKKEPRTCARWERKLGLPVHRIDSDSSRSKVFAYKSELDLWLKQKANHKKHKKKAFWEKKQISIGLASGLALLGIIFAVLLLTHKISPFSRIETPSLVVMPFNNSNSSENDQYFSEGITNELVSNLTRLNEIKIIPAISITNNKNMPLDTKQTIEKLGVDVDYVLKGIVKKVDNKVFLSVQLVKTKNDSNIWKGDFEEPLENLFSIQGMICQKVQELLNLKPPGNIAPALSYGNVRNFDAFDNYLKGNYILEKIRKEDSDPWSLYYQGKYYSGRGAPEANELAINIFSRVLEIDNNFALAYVGLADCYTNYVNFSWDFEISWLKKAEDLIKKAQSIIPDLPEYYSHLIKIYILKKLCFHENKDDLISRVAEEGIKRYPHHPQLNSIVGYYFFQKYGKEGNEADFKKALEYKEKGYWYNLYDLDNLIYAKLLMLNREFFRAMQICTSLEKIDPSLMSKFVLGEIFYYMGDLNQSQAMFQQLDMPLELKIESLFYQAMISSQNKEAEKTQAIIREIQKLSPGEFSFFEADLKWASIHFGLGEKEQGFRYLRSFFNKELSQNEKFIYLRYIDLDRNFNPYKEEKEFKEILKKGD